MKQAVAASEVTSHLLIKDPLNLLQLSISTINNRSIAKQTEYASTFV